MSKIDNNQFHSSLEKPERDFLLESGEVELLSEDVQEILGSIPPWIVRWAITVTFIIFLIILTGSLIFKYPDVIKSSVVIISENPPSSIVSRTTGKIDLLLVKNEQRVTTGEALAILENTADYNHILALKLKLSTLSSILTSSELYPSQELPDEYILGPIQLSYSNFQKLYGEYLNYLSIDLTSKKIVSIEQQITNFLKLLERVKTQQINLERNLDLFYQQFKRDSILFENGVIPIPEFENSEKSFIQVKNNYLSLLASMTNTQMQINQLKYQIIDLQSQDVEKKRRLLNYSKEALDNLKASIVEWEKTFVLSSSIDGEVTFTKYWSKNQYVMTGDIVFTVVPNKVHRILGRIKIPSVGSGKVKVGQIANIQIDNFPYTEFGTLEGCIESISLIPQISQEGIFYIAEVSFPNGLTTNYNKIIPSYQEMYGTAEIITNDLTLFERFINPIKSVLKKSI